MALLKEYIGINYLNNEEKETDIHLHAVETFGIITDEDGECCDYYINIMQFKAGTAPGFRTNKVFVY